MSSAQTVIPATLQDGSTKFVGICNIIEDQCTKDATQCTVAYCRESDNACFMQGKEYGTACTTTASDENNDEHIMPGVCVDGDCIWSVDAECPNPILTADRTFISCGNAGFEKTWRFQNDECLQTGSNCQDIAAQMSNLVCTTGQTKNDPEHQQFTVEYRTGGKDGSCVIGENSENCLIHEAGEYEYLGMSIDWSGTVDRVTEITTEFTIPYTTIDLTPVVLCPSGFCRGTVKCDVIGPEPCGRVTETCPEHAPSLSPVLSTGAPTASGPTGSPIASDSSASSHGDPIIWTFNGDCYDLHADGTYLASSHPWFDHDVYISVYNEYMREIQVVDKDTGNLMLSLNNLGEVINNSYPFFFEEQFNKCEPQHDDECDFFFTEFVFDAQDFEFHVQILPHDYNDSALKEGESGVHLDIYPSPFFSNGLYFHQERSKEYTGLYFHNPLPNVLEQCSA